MILINLTRVVVYIALAALGWFDQVPLWVAPILILYDTSYYWEFKTRQYKQYEASLTQALANIRAREAAEQSESPVKPSEWN